MTIQFNNLFTLVNGRKYDPNRFYTKSTDGNGHYERVPQTKITPTLDALIGELMGAFPTEYKSQGDVVRDALMHLTVYRKNNNTQALDHIQGDIEREAAQQELDRALARLAQWDTYVDNLRDAVGKFVEYKEWGQAVEVLTTAEGMLENAEMPDTVKGRLQLTIEDGWTQLRTEVSTRKRRTSDL